MSNFQIDLDQETKDLFKEFIKELRILNGHLEDFKTMIAPRLGFKVIRDGEKKG